MKLSQEFPMSMRPARPGMYRLRTRHDQVRWACWTGTRWNLALEDFAAAEATEMASSDCYTSYIRGWRGLAEDPNGGAA